MVKELKKIKAGSESVFKKILVGELFSICNALLYFTPPPLFYTGINSCSGL